MAVPRWLEWLGWGALAAVGAGLWLFQDELAEWRMASEHRVIARDCDLQAAPCEIGLSDGSATARLEVGPRPFSHSDTVDVALTLSDGQASEVIVVLRPTSMTMGITSIPLRWDGGAWVSRTMMPVCTERTMGWRADVLIRREGLPEEVVTVDFETRARAG